MQSVSRFENCVETLSQTVASYDAKITNIEQMVSSLAARVTTLETNATSVSSGSGSARSWKFLGHSDGSPAAGSHGPGSSNDNRNTRRRLEMFSMREVPSYYGSLRTIPQSDYQVQRSPLKHDWIKELGSEHAQRPEGQVGQQSRSFQSNQPISSPSRDRSGQPVVGCDPRTAQGGR